MIRFIWILALALLAGCGTAIRSEPAGSIANVPSGSLPYMLPMGLVKAVVFADKVGVGVTLEPAQIYKDSALGVLHASPVVSVFNKETIELKASGSAGLLSLAMVHSEAQILSIVEEAAKSAARISLQNAKVEFLSEKAVFAETLFDPLSAKDVAAASTTICKAVSRAAAEMKVKFQLATFPSGKSHCEGPEAQVALSVTHTDGSAAPAASQPTLEQLKPCALGICARTMTTRVVHVSVNGATIASHAIDIPTRKVVAIPMESSILADRKTTVTVSDGIVTEYKIEKESELLTLVKLPSAAIGGFISGLTDQLTGEKSVADKRKALLDSEKSVLEAENDLRTTALKLQNAPGSLGGNTYRAQATTVYPHRVDIETLLSTLKEQRSEERPAGPSPTAGGGTSDLVAPAPGTPPAAAGSQG